MSSITSIHPSGGDDAPIIQSALASDRTVELRPGNYLLNSQIRIYANGARLTGFGHGSAYLVAGPANRTGDMILINGASEVTIENLTISGGVTPRTSGAAIHAQGPDGIVASNHLFRNLQMTNQFGCLLVDGQTHVIRASDWYCTGIASGGYGVSLNAVTGGNNGTVHVFERLRLFGGSSDANNQPLYGVRLQGTGDCTLDKISTVWCKRGLMIDPPSGQVVEAVKVCDSFFDTSGSHGVHIFPAAGGSVLDVDMTGVWACGAGAGNQTNGDVQGIGIKLDASSLGTIKAITVRGGKIHSTNLYAVQCYGATLRDVDISDVQVYASSLQSATGGGIMLDGSCMGISVRGCGVSDRFGGDAQPYGVRITSGVTRYCITNNRLYNNTTANLQDDGGAVTKVVANNITA